MAWATASSARARSCGRLRLWTGWATSAHRASGTPLNSRVATSTLRKRSVPIRTAGMPLVSSWMALSRPLDEQLPQSPWVRITASQPSISPHSPVRMTRPAL
jgi:hypothetical protein